MAWANSALQDQALMPHHVQLVNTALLSILMKSLAQPELTQLQDRDHVQRLPQECMPRLALLLNPTVEEVSIVLQVLRDLHSASALP